MALTGGWLEQRWENNRFKEGKRKIGDLLFGLNWRMAVIEVDVVEEFYCIVIIR